MPKLGQLTE
jgi:uncharacterized protein Yka (UPF0111/DUF47 family)